MKFEELPEYNQNRLLFHASIEALFFELEDLEKIAVRGIEMFSIDYNKFVDTAIAVWPQSVDALWQFYRTNPGECLTVAASLGAQERNNMLILFGINIEYLHQILAEEIKKRKENEKLKNMDTLTFDKLYEYPKEQAFSPLRFEQQEIRLTGTLPKKHGLTVYEFLLVDPYIKYQREDFQTIWDLRKEKVPRLIYKN